MNQGNILGFMYIHHFCRLHKEYFTICIFVLFLNTLVTVRTVNLQLALDIFHDLFVFCSVCKYVERYFVEDMELEDLWHQVYGPMGLWTI